MRLSLIMAVARNGVIGRNGAIPWRISTDMKRFRALTLGKPIIMGRKQYESVGKPLEERDNIVITRNRAFLAPGVHVVEDLSAAITRAKGLALERGADEIMVIGGAQIYALALPLADRLYLSRIDADIEGDVRFDVPDLSGWRRAALEICPPGPKDEFGHAYAVFDRPAA